MTEQIPFYSSLEKRYIRYGRWILGNRHFAEGRDGLKPVQRRALWTMHEMGAVDKPHMTLAASICGTTMGSYHPHESGSIFTALVNMSQAKMATPPVIGIGNWGSHDSRAAAPRYVKAYLSPYSTTMFDRDELECIPMDTAFTGKDKEPRFLPVRIPHLLLSGCDSLALGYKGDIPPCPPDWVAESVRLTIKNQPLKLPEALNYRWGGRLRKLDDSWLKEGKGSALFTPRITTETDGVILTSLAPHLSVETVERLCSKHPEYAGLVEESPTGDGIIRIVIKVKRGTSVTEFARKVQKSCRTQMHYSFLQIRQFADDTGEIDFQPIIQGPEDYLKSWVRWRRSVVVASANLRATKARSEFARIGILIRAIDLRKELLKIMDQAKSTDDIRQRTMKLLKCGVEEANTVMGIPWPKLARMEKPPFLEKQAKLKAFAAKEDAVAEKPIPRLLENLNSAIVGIDASVKQAKSMLDDSTRIIKRRRRAT